MAAKAFLDERMKNREECVFNNLIHEGKTPWPSESKHFPNVLGGEKTTLTVFLFDISRRNTNCHILKTYLTAYFCQGERKWANAHHMCRPPRVSPSRGLRSNKRGRESRMLSENQNTCPKDRLCSYNDYVPQWQ